MSPEQRADRLDRIACDIEAARRLVLAGRMALDKPSSVNPTAEEADALLELLGAIGDRLKVASNELRETMQAAA